MEGNPGGAKRHSLGAKDGRSLGGSAGAISVIPNLPPAIPGLVAGWRVAQCAGSARPGSGRPWPDRSFGMLYRRHLQRGEKGGSEVGKTKRGKGTKLMVIADATGLPLAVHTASASPHEVTLVEATLAQTLTVGRPERLVGDRAYDSDPLDQRLAAQGIELISPHKCNRVKAATQDGRPLRRYRRRWKIERTFAWLNKFRRILTRWEYHARNFTAFVHLACALILLRRGL